MEYLPQKQWKNYTTNRNLYLQSIHCPLRGIETVHNPLYFQNLLFDYKINDSNIKIFYDRTNSYIIYLLQYLACHFFINIWASVMKRNLLNYLELIRFYNTRIHSKLKAFLTKVSEINVLNIQLPLLLLGSQNRFDLLANIVISENMVVVHLIKLAQLLIFTNFLIILVSFL